MLSLTRLKWLWALPLLLVVSCDRDPKVIGKKFVEKGNDYFKREKYKEASIMYRRALQQDLRYPDAWYRLGLVNLKLKLVGEAHRDFGRALELDPNNQDAAIQQAELLIGAYHSDPEAGLALRDEASEIIRKWLKRDPDSFDAHRLKGTLAAVERDYPKSIEELKRANALKPDHPDVTYVLMQSLIATGDTASAEKYGLRQLAVTKDAGAIYDKLEEIYLRTNRQDRAEQILEQKVANISDGINLVELARFYYLAKRPKEVDAAINRLTSDRKKYPQGYLQAGDYYASVRDFPAAIQEYQAGEKADSKNKRTYLKRQAAALTDSGRTPDAVALLARLIKDDPNDAEATAIHASLVMQLGANREQIKDVISELQPLVNRNSNKPLLHYSLARAYRIQGDTAGLEQSRLQLEETLKLDPSNLAARLDLARLYLDRNEAAKAVESASDILRRNPENMPAMLIRGFAFLRMAEPDKAQSEFSGVLKSYPGSNDARYGLALCSVQQKHFDAAEKDFQALINAKDSRGTEGLVNLRLAQHRYSEALKLVADQVKLNPTPANVEQTAVILFQAERWKEAAEAYDKVTSEDPQKARNWILLGEARERSGNIDGAMEAYSKARQLAPNDVNAAMLLGRLYDTQNRPSDAMKIYQDVLKLQPNDAYALNNVAFHKAEEGSDLNLALTYAQRAREQKPDEIDFQDTTALIYLKKNLADESLRLLQGVVAHQPDRPLYRLHLAMAYYQKGNQSAARKELEAATKYNPTPQEKTKIRELLGKMG